MTDKIGNNYGAAFTAEEVVEWFRGRESHKEFELSLGSNLAVRHYLMGRGFNRVSRDFADAVIAAAA